MKKFLFSILFLPVLASAQFTDDFSDGDFTNNPIWSGDTSRWEVLNFQLHSIDSIASDTFYLSTPSALATTAQWEFWINLAFNTSSTNYVKVFLTSDMANLKGNNSGYFVELGNTADNLVLYKKNGATSTALITGAGGVLNHSNNILKVKITRDASNLWTLWRDTTGTGNYYKSEGTATDATFFTSSYFGLLVKQSTSSFFGKHYFDDFYAGPIIVDTVPPAVTSLNVISQTQLDVQFSEGVDSTRANKVSNYFASNGLGNPSSAKRDASNFSLVHLTFATNFQSGLWNTLTTDSVQDFSLNTMVQSVDSFLYYVPQKYDVVINEIMAHPSSVTSLPNYEYAELYNRTPYPINLSNWTFSASSTTKTFSSITLQPKSYLILCLTSAVSSFQPYGNTLGLFSSSTTLTDAGTTLTLKDQSGNLIHTVTYSDTWYQDANKGNGGWSLEQIDPNNFCGGKNNWRASVNPSGGTPGKINSINGLNPDNAAPKLLRAYPVAADTVQLFFDEPMDNTSLANLSAYIIDNGIGNPNYANPVAPDYSSVMIALASPISSGIIYTVTVNSSVKDCAGNSIGIKNSARFALAQPASRNDIVVNEVMFDPLDNGVEWTEIYNRSDKIIDLKEISVCNLSSSGNFSNIKQIAPSGFLIFPGDYFVLSTDQSAIKAQYSTPNPEGFIDMSSFISLSNDSAYVILINASQNIIDSLHYSSGWELPLLSSSKGISLERINYDMPTQDATNWHSAAESVGGATPAYKNSQYTAGETGNEITISPEVFSPDNDGYNDVLTINYSFDNPGLVGNVQIFDSRGRLIKNLVRNELLAASGTFFWDGITDEKTKARIGIYVIWLEVFDDKGNVKKYKKSCVVAGKL
ncbi:MAG: lamin tail domain-containing protein [Bacteroidetes bacterium]|nr:lamin tail domain-containing protein [Bacteroidota bacterium]